MAKVTRRQARERILKEVNKLRVRHYQKPLTMKNIQKAVFIFRQNQLMSPKKRFFTLERAGFNIK